MIRPLSDKLLNLGYLVGQWFLIVCLYESSCPLALWTASGPWQNLSANKSCTCIQSSTRITLDHLATTRSFVLGKLLAFWLGNLRSPLFRAAMVSWSWCWRPICYIGYVQATFFSHRYNSSSSGFIERKLQLFFYYHWINKSVDLQIVFLASLCPSIWLDRQRFYKMYRTFFFWEASADLIQDMGVVV